MDVPALVVDRPSGCGNALRSRSGALFFEGPVLVPGGLFVVGVVSVAWRRCLECMIAEAQPCPSDELDTLWERFGDELLRFATVLVGPSDAPDVTVDAFMRAASSSQHADVANQRAYLFRAVANEASNWRRSSQRRSARELRQLGPGTTSGPDSMIDVRRAVADLSVRQRAVVYLIYWEDRTPSDVAAMLEMSPSSVHQHLHRAKSHLRKALK